MSWTATDPSFRILLSAYSCEPGKGSEAGVGWHWAIEMSRLGHRVSVLTRLNNRAVIEAALAAPNACADASNLEFIYYDLPIWARWWKRNGRGVHLYYLLWQILAYRAVRTIHREQPFDAIHHLTFGVIRYPSLLGRLGTPFVVGPLGGGEVTPSLLRRAFPWPPRVRERLRDLANLIGRYGPLVRSMYRDADVILCKTSASLHWVPQRHQARARCMLEIGIWEPQADNVVATAISQAPLRLVYVGRFLSWKGMDLGLRAVAQLRTRGVSVTLTMIGQGPQGQRWQALAATLGIQDSITWVPWISQDLLMSLYPTFDALLFPSLHDSSGNVVLESLSHGLPVVCLDLGGPAEVVTRRSGLVIGTHGKTVEQVVEALSRSLYGLATQPAWRNTLRIGARQRASEFAWSMVVGRVWGRDGVGSRLLQAGRECGSRAIKSTRPASALYTPAKHASRRENL